MIETNTHTPNAGLKRTDSDNTVQTRRDRGPSNFKPLNFEQKASRNPCHDGCNVSKEQLEAQARPKTNEASAVTEATNTADSNGGIEKAAGGNCPGSNMIAQILQDLVAALEATQSRLK